jgi:hypothetical protein
MRITFAGGKKIICEKSKVFLDLAAFFVIIVMMFFNVEEVSQI